MQLIIDIPDNLTSEQIEQIITTIKSQMQINSYSVHQEEPDINKFLEWSDRHPYSLKEGGVPPREERNVR